MSYYQAFSTEERANLPWETRIWGPDGVGISGYILAEERPDG